MGYEDYGNLWRVSNEEDGEVVLLTGLDAISASLLRFARRLLAKSVIFVFLEALEDVKKAVYPKLNILAFENSGSDGGNFSGQKVSTSPSLVHVVILLPPSP